MAIRVLRTSTGILRTSSGIRCYDFTSSVNVSAIGTPDWWIFNNPSYGTKTNNLTSSSTAIYEYPYTFMSERRFFVGFQYTIVHVFHQSSLVLSLIDGVLTWTLYVKVTCSSFYYNYMGSVEWWGTKTGIDPKGTYTQSNVVLTGAQVGTYPASASVS
jgi:hypothetical protein